jgi:hypothetical protein
MIARSVLDSNCFLLNSIVALFVFDILHGFYHWEKKKERKKYWLMLPMASEISVLRWLRPMNEKD